MISIIIQRQLSAPREVANICFKLAEITNGNELETPNKGKE